MWWPSCAIGTSPGCRSWTATPSSASSSRRDLLRLLSRNDDQIAADLAAVVDDLPAESGRWRVEVADGVVSLIPHGSPQLGRLLERLAWAIPGVVDVRQAPVGHEGEAGGQGRP